MVYRILGCRFSCWLHGIRIRTRKKKLTKRERYNSAYYQQYGSTNRPYSDLPNDDVEANADFSLSVENIQKLCCLTISQRKREREIIVPNSLQVTYGSFQQEQTKNFTECQQCCSFSCLDRFPKQPKNDTCPICLDPFTDETALVLLECSHGYHDKCLTSWLQSKGASYVQCPICNHGMYIEGFSQENEKFITKPLPYMYGFHTLNDTFI